MWDVASDVLRDELRRFTALADAAQPDAVGLDGGRDVDLGPIVYSGEALVV